MNAKTKEERRADAIDAAMARVLRRLASLAMAQMRADAAWEAYHSSATVLFATGKSDDELIANIDKQIARVENTDFTRSSAHLTMFLALLYVVAEGWRKWGFFDPKVDARLNSPFVGELKEFRHAIFHASEHDNKDVMQFAGTEERAQWVGALSNELRDALRDWHRNLRQRVEEYLVRQPL